MLESVKSVTDMIKGYAQKMENSIGHPLYHKPSDFGKYSEKTELTPEQVIYVNQKPSGKNFVKPAVAGGASSYAVADFASKIGENRAYGDFSNDVYFCNPNKLSLAKFEYIDEVHSIDNAVEFFTGTTSEINDKLFKGDMKTIDEMARCLKEEFDVNPDSVAMFSDRTQDVLSYDIPRLMEVAPHLTDYATVPEGIVAKGLLMGSIGAISLTSPYIRKNLYKAGFFMKSGISNVIGKLRKSSEF